MENNWKDNNITVGLLTEGESIEIKFESSKELDIQEIKPGCTNCTTVNGYKDNILSITYKADSIPYHITTKTHSVIKYIYILYKDGNTEVLRFNVRIIRK